MESGNEERRCCHREICPHRLPATPTVVKIAADWRNERTQEGPGSRSASADFFALVKGHAELGGYVTTGNTENVGITAALELKREAPQWRHKLRVQADYQESLGITTRERYLAAYEPNWKFDDRAYLYGAAQYGERPLLGIHRPRFHVERYRLQRDQVAGGEARRRSRAGLSLHRASSTTRPKNAPRARQRRFRLEDLQGHFA